MLEIVRSTQFKRDVKLAEKRGKDMAKLRDLILLLAQGAPLPSSYKDHPLSGDWQHYRDSHIDRIGFCSIESMATILYLVRTGTHADLF